MRVLGFDPGTATIGFGYVECHVGRPARALQYGIIKTEKTLAMPLRLADIYADMNALLTAMRRSLVELNLGLKGDLTMTEPMEKLTKALANDQVCTCGWHACPPAGSLHCACSCLFA